MIISITAIAAASLLSPADVADIVAPQATDTTDNSACIETVSSQEKFNIKMGVQASFSLIPISGGGYQQGIDDWN